MGVFQMMNEKIKEGVRSWLSIKEPMAVSVSIMPTLDYFGNAVKNRIWYRGDSAELSQLYGQLPQIGIKNTFWGASSTAGMEIRKIHTGIPALTVDVLTNVTISKYHTDITNKMVSDLWDKIDDDNKFRKVIEKAVKDVLVIGDGAFKISFDSVLSQYPIIEWYSGDDIDIVTDRGRVKEIVFKTPLTDSKGTEYVLHEHYGIGYVEYELMRDGKNIPADGIDLTRNLQNVTFGGDNPYMLAVPVCFFSSPRFKGRGQSIFDKKIDAYDALDEAWSQWMDALRAGRTKEYIPENILPRNPETGEVMQSNAFDNRYIKTSADMRENANNKIEVVNPEIPHESYMATYITALDLALQGIISPSTLGIDTKKLDNAEAQREKEKATLYTRDAIVDALTDDVNLLIKTALKGYAEWAGLQIDTDAEISVDFGNYANPSFESQIETISKARLSRIMSVEAAVDELYGDSKDDEWKEAEVARLKEEMGIAEMTEPYAGMDAIDDNGKDDADDSDDREQDISDGTGTDTADAESSK